MHIAYLHYLTQDDTALVHVQEFTAAARALGAGVSVHAMNLAPGSADEEVATSLRLRVREQLQRRLARYLHEPKELLWNPLYARREIELIRRERPDVLLVRSHSLTASCIAVARATGVPLVLEVNSPATESELYFDEYLHLPGVHEWLETRRLRAADRVIVVSEALRQHVVDRHGIESEKVVAVQNGADIARFHPGVVPDPHLETLCAGRPTVGFVGSFQKFHGVDGLATMMRTVGSARADTCFLLVGDGPELPHLRDATRALGDRVICTGSIPHERIPAAVACLDVAVLPETGFYCSPLKLLEWMAAARPIVAAARPAVAEIAVDGEHARLVPPGDAGALHQAVLDLLDHPDIGQRLGAAAADHVRKSLTWQQNAARVLDVCRAAISLQTDAKAA